jgi:steroid delta-isomerase-like uncharacterized protein
MAIEVNVKKWIEDFNRHDADALGAAYAAETVVTDPQYSDPLRGQDAVVRDFVDFFTAFPDVRVELKGILTNGDTYAFEATVRGTHKGALMFPTGLVPATGKPLEFSGGMFGRVDSEGRIAEEHRYYDVAGQLTQLGLMD